MFSTKRGVRAAECRRFETLVITNQVYDIERRWMYAKQ